MKRYEIRKLFYSAYNRLERSIGLPTDFDEDLYFLNDINWEFDEAIVETWINQFYRTLEELEIWLDEIFPENPDWKDKRTLQQFKKAIEFARTRLVKIEKLIGKMEA